MSPQRPPLRKIIRRTAVKAERANAFFMAGAVAFNILLAAVPFVFLLLGLAGFLLPLVDDPREIVLRFVSTGVSTTTGDWGSLELVERVLGGLVRDRTGVSLLGTVLFAWFSTRLAGSLRTVLREVFEIEPSKGVIHGKLYDAGAVLVGTLLISINLAMTIFLQAWGSEGLTRLGVHGDALSFLEAFLVRVTGFSAIWVMSLVVYRFLADERVLWRTAIVAATTMTVIHEALKFVFGWYVTSVASYGSVYGNLANLAVLFFWVYYASSAFVFSGIFAYAWTTPERLGNST